MTEQQVWFVLYILAAIASPFLALALLATAVGVCASVWLVLHDMIYVPLYNKFVAKTKYFAEVKEKK